MIRLSTLEEKNKDSTGKINFLSNRTKVNLDNLTINDWVLIKEGDTARIDILGLLINGNINYIDLLCKVNGISNPFNIQEGDVIAIPDPSSLSNQVTKRINIKPIEKQTEEESDPNDSSNITSPGIRSRPKTNYIKKENGITIF